VPADRGIAPRLAPGSLPSARKDWKKSGRGGHEGKNKTQKKKDMMKVYRVPEHPFKGHQKTRSDGCRRWICGDGTA